MFIVKTSTKTLNHHEFFSNISFDNETKYSVIEIVSKLSWRKDSRQRDINWDQLLKTYFWESLQNILVYILGKGELTT